MGRRPEGPGAAHATAWSELDSEITAYLEAGRSRSRVALGTVPLLFVFGAMLWQEATWSPVIRFALGFVVVGALSTVGQRSYLEARSLRLSLARVAAAADPRSINVLARAAVRLRGDLRVEAHRALRRVVPSLADQHAGVISDQGMKDLCALLSWDSLDSHLEVAILELFRRVGDERVLAAVEAMQAPPPRIVRELQRQRLASLDSAVDRVSAAAREASGQIRQRQMLLRPASAPPVTHPDALLRPALEARPKSMLRQPLLRKPGIASRQDARRGTSGQSGDSDDPRIGGRKWAEWRFRPRL